MNKIINYLKQDFCVNKKPAVIVGIFAIIMGLLIVYFLGQPPQPLLKNNLIEVSGKLDKFEPSEGKSDSTIYLQGGGKYFVFEFIHYFDLKDFARDVKNGDNVTLYCEMSNTKIGNAYIVEANGKQYLTLNESNKDITSNNFVGFILGWTITGLGSVILIAGVIGYLLRS